MTVKFAGFECNTQVGRYANGRMAIQLMDVDDGCPVATATVNLPDQHMGHDEVAIKNWSENEGMVEALVEAGVILPECVRLVEEGFVKVPIHRLHTGEPT